MRMIRAPETSASLTKEYGTNQFLFGRKVEIRHMGGRGSRSEMGETYCREQ